MIPEIGHYALILALCLAVLQLIPIYRVACRSLAIGQFFLVGTSFVCLAIAFITNDFTVAYVAENSNTHLPLIYRFCALWGAHEGSLLLWVFILTIWMALVSLFSRHLPLDMLGRVLTVLSGIAIGFYLLILMTSNPFLRIFTQVPADGNGLNPLLQDPGLVSHPPILYMGYVGFSVAFAFSIAALWAGRFDVQWMRWSRPWTLAAWCFLTAGIVLGSWWAYRELGWGGWWFWDPVENASFLPWLAGTALIHSMAASAKRDVFKSWTALLAVCAFSLSLLGTFLVRSGVLVSVHAFASDPKRGAFILQFLTIVIGGSLLLYAFRSKRLTNSGTFDFWSRESILLANNVILFSGMLTVLLGTLYPLIIDALNLGKISVGPPYFNLVFIPLMIPLLFLMGIGPTFYWQKSQPKLLLKRFSVIFISSLLLSLMLPFLAGANFRFSILIGLTLVFWVLLNTITETVIGTRSLTVAPPLPPSAEVPANAFHLSLSTDVSSNAPQMLNHRTSAESEARPSGSAFFRRLYHSSGMVAAHLGLLVTVLGIILSTAYSDQRDLVMKIGETVAIQNYEFKLMNLQNLQGANYHGATATVFISKNHHYLSILHPQLRIYDVEQTALSKTDIDVGIFRDLYVALGQPLSNGEWGMRIYYKPFVRWIWMGGLIMVGGGLLSLWNRRKKKIYES